MFALFFFLGSLSSIAGKYVNKHQFEPHSNRLILAQVSIGGECWSSANGVAAGGCASLTQCGPWLPDGGSWDGTSPWYCLASPKLTSGATCDYAAKVTVLLFQNLLQKSQLYTFLLRMDPVTRN